MKKNNSVFNNFGNNPKYNSDLKKVNTGIFDNDVEFAEEIFKESYETHNGFRKKSDSDKAKQNNSNKST